MKIQTFAELWIIHDNIGTNTLFPQDQSILESLTIDSCEKYTTLTFPVGTAVFTCENSGLASLSVTTQSQITLKKMFVFGVLFSEASAPPGYRNTGTQFEICPPGTNFIISPPINCLESELDLIKTHCCYMTVS